MCNRMRNFKWRPHNIINSYLNRIDETLIIYKEIKLEELLTSFGVESINNAGKWLGPHYFCQGRKRVGG